MLILLFIYWCAFVYNYLFINHYISILFEVWQCLKIEFWIALGWIPQFFKIKIPQIFCASKKEAAEGKGVWEVSFIYINPDL